MQQSPIIQAQNLTYEFISYDNHIRVLQNLNLSILTGEQVAIIGSSGSGKSTLLSLLAGLDVPTTGSVQIQSKPFSSLDEDGRAAIRAKNMGFVFQSFQLLPSLTALENVMLPLQLKSDPNAKVLSLEALKKVGLSERVQHYPKQLSGGEQQRVAIARAFATQPLILFADEPTGNLDNTTGQVIIELLFKMNREAGTTLVLVTHDVHLANRCQRQLRLENGVLAELAPELVSK
ncbi:MAG: ABC transporter ATP-binding protein [Methylotenera sp.]|uniref:ABC transporter ATP-binding protein n=1 Tax=Methylotenera sp. TaxID=2051956 RepID=UPI00272026DB|nr:ABC transporter ATP-binding protein [Methylotenera sp.]MDO9393876.1 ABC transporter ATP-binding protein [Methylotenera sp.]MDP1523107.1 ABC transporter ATP-binding protein [Methylotenera sp.]MDP2230612.1 ABC transporter ATP-binding protein [Methylotenera sp.]MDP3140694.1 ABC transporter ATP-binding protein [Methylotenera sp.]